MPRPIRLLLVLLGLLGAGGGVAGAVQPSVVMNRYFVDVDLRPDGTATIVLDERRTPSSDATAAQLGQMPLPFNPTLEKLEVLEAYTQKQDGRRLAVDLGQVRTQLLPGVANVPIFRDVQEKVVIFPDLAQHDTEVLRVRQEIVKPLFPGQFFWVLNFPRTVAWEDVEFRIRVPQGMTLHSEVVGMAEEVSPVEGGTLHVWRYRRTDVIAEDLAAVSSWERLPRLMVSTLPDYAALADAYARGAAGTAEVTPGIQAKADEITAGITDRRAQARAIYEWVSAHVRYVALYLGVGGVVPHTAEEVLANGYGDCKDHTALFEALLKAKGIEAQTVLINLDNAYRLSSAPTLAQLNHAITYLPEFDLYADTTTAMAPFGVLPFQEYGKPVVVVGAGGTSVRRIPPLPPGLASITAVTSARMQLDGAILGTTRIEATGPAAIALRLAARWVQTAGHEGAARRQLGNLGEEGSGIYAFASPDEFEPGYVVNGRFQLDPMPELLEGDSFVPPLGLLLLIRPGDFFLGPLHRPALPVEEDTPCFSGRQVEELRLELPEGRAPVRLPKDTDIRNPQFSYTSRWKLEGQMVSVRRELVAAFDVPLCSGALRRETAAAMVRIRRDQRARIVLNEP